MKKIVCITLLAIVGSGCSVFPGVTNKIVDGVDEYCSRITAAERAVIRNNVNETLAGKGHSIAVTCAGD